MATIPILPLGLALAMKILIALNSAWNLLNFRSNLIRALIDDGHTVVLAAPSDENVPALQALGARFIDLPLQTHGTNPIADLLLLGRFINLLYRERPNVFLGYTAKPNIYGSLAAHFLNIPVINNISGLGSVFIKGGLVSKVLQLLYRSALRRSKWVFFQNPDDLQLFLSLGLVKQKQVKILPGSGVDLQKFQKTPLPYFQTTGSNNIGNRNFVFLLITRMLRDKGVEEFVNAARSIKESHPEVRCALLGFIDNDNPNSISSRKIQEWVDEGVVNYWGTSTDVRVQLAQADCVVLPSYREGTPRTLLEAAAMGRFLIATDVPGCREVVRDGFNGLLCQPKSYTSLAEKMVQALCIPDSQYKDMAQKSRQWVEERFDERLVISEYLMVLHILRVQNFTLQG
jgi:glycosyltransferase involved in cell wall biosynthesis